MFKYVFQKLSRKSFTTTVKMIIFKQMSWQEDNSELHLILTFVFSHTFLFLQAYLSFFLKAYLHNIL